MKNTKISDILRTFTKEEIKSFENFLISPFFASRRNVKPFYNLLKKYYPDFDISKKEFFLKLYPGEKYDERKLKNLGSQLIHLAEQFLVHTAIKNNNTGFDMQLARQYKERKNNKIFLSTLKALENKIEGKLFNSVECFSEKEEIEWMKMGYYIEKNDYEKSINLRANHIEYVTASFLILFLRRLRDKQSFISYNIPFGGPLINTVSENIDFHKIIVSLDKINYPLIWLLKIYYYVYRATMDFKDDESFVNLKKIFYENIEKLSRPEKFFLFNDLADCCTIRESAGIIKYREEELGIYKEMLKHNAWSSAENEYLSIVSYRNVMLLALTLREYIWLNDFIENYTGKLSPEYRENMMNLANANLCFEKGEFENALGYISKVHYDFFLYKTDIKNLMLKIYYELDLFDPAFSLIDAYRHFLAETTEIEEHFKKQYYNFINIYNRILKAKSDGDISDIDFITTEIEKMDVISHRLWLKEKALNLIKKGAK